MRNAYRILIRKYEGKRPLGRYRCKLENSIKINLEEIWYEDVGWIHLDWVGGVQ
jgi:hypothetical protein